MSLKKYLPSLMVDGRVVITKSPYHPELVTIPTDRLIEFCCDKQRVKEVIEKFRDLIFETEGSDYGYNDLLEELELNK